MRERLAQRSAGITGTGQQSCALGSQKGRETDNNAHRRENVRTDDVAARSSPLRWKSAVPPEPSLSDGRVPILLEGGHGDPPAGPPGDEPFVPNDESPSWSSSVIDRPAVDAATAEGVTAVKLPSRGAAARLDFFDAIGNSNPGSSSGFCEYAEEDTGRRERP